LIKRNKNEKPKCFFYEKIASVKTLNKNEGPRNAFENEYKKLVVL
jgi:hypothetical protein